jgi:hypothetical protein
MPKRTGKVQRSVGKTMGRWVRVVEEVGMCFENSVNKEMVGSMDGAAEPKRGFDPIKENEVN